MKDKFESFISFILVILIIAIIALTGYFCVDLFGIVEIPEEYSLAKYFFDEEELIVIEGQELTTDIIDNTVKRFAKDDKEDSSDQSMNTIISSMKEASSNNFNSEQPATSSLLNKKISVKYFYYDQLDKYGKIIYDGLCSELQELKTGRYTCNFGTQFNDLLHENGGTETLNNSFQLAINALTFDNPELFYLDVTKMYLMTETTTRAFTKTYVVKVGGNEESYLADEFDSSENVNFAIKQVEVTKNYLVDSANQADNNLDKIRLVHDYLVDTIDYDLNAGSNVYNIYGALINHKAVCEGYARSFKYIMDKLSIPCIIACGIAENSSGQAESHAWNYVQIDGKWYAIDVTWDDPVIIGNGRIDSSIRRAYYLKGSNEFFKDHYEDGNIVGSSNFRYPELSKENY